MKTLCIIACLALLISCQEQVPTNTNSTSQNTKAVEPLEQEKPPIVEQPIVKIEEEQPPKIEIEQPDKPIEEPKPSPIVEDEEPNPQTNGDF